MKTNVTFRRLMLLSSVLTVFALLAALFQSCRGDEPVPVNPPEPPVMPVAGKKITVDVDSMPGLSSKMPDIKAAMATDKDTVVVNLKSNFGVKLSDFPTMKEFDDIRATANPARFLVNQNGTVIYPADPNMALSSDQAAILAKWPFILNLTTGYRFLILAADANMFTAQQLEYLGFSDGSLIMVTNAAEFESKITEAAAMAKSGERIEVRFLSMDLDEKQLPALRQLWGPNIRFGSNDGADVRVTASGHPTSAYNLGSVYGWQGTIRLIIPDNPDAPGGLNAIIPNDTVFGLLGTPSVPKGAGEGVYVTDTDPVLGLWCDEGQSVPSEQDLSVDGVPLAGNGASFTALHDGTGWNKFHGFPMNGGFQMMQAATNRVIMQERYRNVWIYPYIARGNPIDFYPTTEDKYLSKDGMRTLVYNSWLLNTFQSLFYNLFNYQKNGINFRMNTKDIAWCLSSSDLAWLRGTGGPIPPDISWEQWDAEIAARYEQLFKDVGIVVTNPSDLKYYDTRLAQDSISPNQYREYELVFPPASGAPSKKTAYLTPGVIGAAYDKDHHLMTAAERKDVVQRQKVN